MKISEEISRTRFMVKLTRIKLARLLGVTENTIYNWETGKSEPSASQMEKIRRLKSDNKR